MDASKRSNRPIQTNRSRIIMVSGLRTLTMLALAAVAPELAAATTISVTAETAVASEEGPSPGVFKLSRAGDFSRSLNVNIALAGTALASTDYLVWEKPVHFEPGASTARVAVLPVNDSVQEGNESIVLSLLPGADYVVTSPSNAAITIRDKFRSGFRGVFDPTDIDTATGRIIVETDITAMDAWIASGRLNVQIELSSANTFALHNIALFLNTDQNATTGDYRAGRLGGQEYRVAVSAGLVPGYDLYRLLTVPPASGDPRRDRYLSSGAVTQSGRSLNLAIPLAKLGGPSAVDVIASSHIGGDRPTTPGGGDRAPNYGAFDTAGRKLVLRNPGITQRVKVTDRAGDSLGEFDLLSADYETLGDQFRIALAFDQPFDPSNPALHYSALAGQITLDADQNLLTGAFFMGSQIPTWGGDLALSYNVGSYWAPFAEFMVFTDVLGNWVSLGQQDNDGRWSTVNRTLTLGGSLSIFDAFRRVVEPPGQTPVRIMTRGRMFAQAVNYGYDLISVADASPNQYNAIDTGVGKLSTPLNWEATRTVSRSDPLDHGGLAGIDLTRLDAQVIGNKLVIKGVLSSWINTDNDNLFEVLLDTDLNAATGLRWANDENGGPAIGADYVLEIGSFSIDLGAPSVYVAELVRPNGMETRHEAMLLPQPASSFTKPGSFTVTIPLAVIGETVPPRLRFYLTTAKPDAGTGRIDTAPPGPFILGAP